MPQRTHIKIYNLTHKTNIDTTIETKTDAIGLMFYAKNPHHVDVTRTAALAQQLPTFVTPIKLFVNTEPTLIARAAADIPNLMLQFHNNESPAACMQTKQPYLRATHMVPNLNLLDFTAQHPSTRTLLLDAHVKNYSDSGKIFDWSLIPRNVPLPVILSDKLHTKNVIKGILQIQPQTVNINSNIEATKDIKNAAAIGQFCETIRETNAHIASSNKA